eukprot:7326074-Prorocentrum_lima.AAC.1
MVRWVRPLRRDSRSSEMAKLQEVTARADPAGKCGTPKWVLFVTEHSSHLVPPLPVLFPAPPTLL